MSVRSMRLPLLWLALFALRRPLPERHDPLALPIIDRDHLAARYLGGEERDAVGLLLDDREFSRLDLTHDARGVSGVEGDAEAFGGSAVEVALMGSALGHGERSGRGHRPLRPFNVTPTKS